MKKYKELESCVTSLWNSIADALERRRGHITDAVVVTGGALADARGTPHDDRQR